MCGYTTTSRSGSTGTGGGYDGFGHGGISSVTVALGASLMYGKCRLNERLD